jgi:hypothetical protein
MDNNIQQGTTSIYATGKTRHKENFNLQTGNANLPYPLGLQTATFHPPTNFGHPLPFEVISCSAENQTNQKEKPV